MKCEILTRLLIVLSIGGRILPDCYAGPRQSTHEPRDPPGTIRLALPPCIKSLELVSIQRLPLHLHLSHSRLPTTTRLVTVWAILLAGNIELNPGPLKRGKWKYPCGVCSASVKSTRKVSFVMFATRGFMPVVLECLTVSIPTCNHLRTPGPVRDAFLKLCRLQTPPTIPS